MEHWETSHPNTQGLEGLQLGFSLCVKLLQNFPDLFPVKPKQRENAINWLTDNIQSRLDDAADIENLLQVQTELDALVEVVQQRLSPEVNPLNKLVKRIRERVEQTGAIDGGEEGEGRKTGRQEAVVGPKTETAVTSAPASRSVPVGAIADRTQAFKQLEKIAVFLEKTEPHSPVHMLLRKAVAWGGLSMQEVLAELLADQNSAREHVWEMLGLKEEDD